MFRFRHRRFALFLVLLCIGAALLWRGLGAERAFLTAFIASATIFILSALPLWRATDHRALTQRDIRDDGGVALLLLTAATVLGVVLVAVGRVIQAQPAMVTPDLVLLLASLLSAWVFMHLVYAFHYAHLFYAPGVKAGERGLAFPGTDAPGFSDFCYFSYVVGITSQTSDVTVRHTAMRRTVMIHGVLSFIFNLGVLALTINVVASSV